jgi:hypothetical protein
MRKTLMVIASLALAAPLAAQQAGMTMAHDPTAVVKGSGELPSGWMLRFDPPRRPGTPPPAATAVSVTAEGKGYHFRSGPAAVYYDAKNVGKGDYSVSATFSQPKSMQHEAYGLVIGGDHLQDSTQSYLYFIVRPMDGGVLINHRNGDDAKKIVKLVDWTPNPAVHKDDAATGAATNQLAIRVAKDSVHFLANGAQVKALSRAELQSQGVSLDGIAGLRVNHNLDLQVEGFGVKPEK